MMKSRALDLLLEAIRFAAHDWCMPPRVRRALDEDWRRTQQLMNQQHPGDGYYLNRKRHRVFRLPVVRHLRCGAAGGSPSGQWSNGPLWT